MGIGTKGGGGGGERVLSLDGLLLFHADRIPLSVFSPTHAAGMMQVLISRCRRHMWVEFK